MRFGEFLIAHLRAYGVRHVFGIPGVHTAELYRGLHGSGIRHIAPRHEQGAGFMADGYARMTAQPGVCFVITGPGVTNIATAMGQAYQDSIPMLVISGVNAIAELGHGRGNLHELPDQRLLASGVSGFSHTLLRPEDLSAVMVRAFALFRSARPRPVHIEIPLDVMAMEVAAPVEAQARTVPPCPPDDALDEAARLLDGAAAPIILAGGGAVWSGAPIAALAERLDAPVVMTVNGRGLMPFGHPLAVPASPSLEAVRALVASADVVLAVGTEIGPTDYDMYARGGFSIPGQLVRIDIDPLQIMRNRVPDLPLPGDSATAIRALLPRLAASARDRDGAGRTATTRSAARASLSPEMRRHLAFLDAVRDALPDAVIVGDSTQPVYAGNLCYEPDAPRGWFNSATGFGTLGYALPAAIGAKLGAPERPVVCLVGDGGLQFSIGELASAVDAATPIIVLAWNNCGYREIRTYMEERGIRPQGVDLATPDFVILARACGLAAERLGDPAALAALLGQAAARKIPTLIDIDEAAMMA